MHDEVRRFISDCARSNVGRLVFVGYLVYLVSMIGYTYGQFPHMTYPFLFYRERDLFELMNWPQMELIRSSRLIFRWQASKFSDTLAAVYIALPWWVYGHIFERIVKRIADVTPRQSIAEHEFGTFIGRGQPNEFFEWTGIPCARERSK